MRFSRPRIIVSAIPGLLLALMVSATAHAQTLTVSAAVTLNEAFRALAPRFEAQHPGAQLRFNFGASGILLQQIARGAPVDVFASADQTTMEQGIQQQLMDITSKTDFARNAVVMVTPVGHSPALQSLADLQRADVKRIAIGKADRAPAGRYAAHVLKDAGLLEPLTPKLVYADTVRQVLDYVARQEAEAGFVHRTDAALMPDKVRVVMTMSGQAHPPYPAAVVKASEQKALALAFVQFLASPPAQELLQAHGFAAP